MDDIKRPKFITVPISSYGSTKEAVVTINYASVHKDQSLEEVTTTASENLSVGSSKEVLVYELVRVLKAQRVVSPMDVEYERKEQVKTLPKPHREI